MATETKATDKHTHACDWCGDEFVCTTHRIGDLAVSTCDCLQSIVKTVTEEENGVVDGPNELVFFCDQDCWDETYPEDSSDEEGAPCFGCGEIHD